MHTYNTVKVEPQPSTIDERGFFSSFPLAWVLPEQIYGSLCSPFARTGTGRLMCAVLEEALTCLQRAAFSDMPRAQRLAREAYDWFSSDDAEHAFSFVTICTALGLEPTYIRRHVERWANNLREKKPHKKGHSMRILTSLTNKSPERRCKNDPEEVMETRRHRPSLQAR